MQRNETSVIRMTHPDDLTAPSKRRLRTGIEEFVRLSDSLDAYIRFSRKWPELFPADISSGDEKSLSWAPACHQLVIVYRDFLRWLWRLQPNAMDNEFLPLLMGLAYDLYNMSDKYLEHLDPLRYRGPTTIESVWGQAWKQVRDTHPGAYVLGNRVFPSWKSGEFIYQPYNDFQHAIYLLFKERWRAKMCYQCSEYFVARRPPQSYCSKKCFQEAKRTRDLKWRKRERAKGRKPRTTSTRKKGG